jgi:hypothetical protein
MIGPGPRFPAFGAPLETVGQAPQLRVKHIRRNLMAPLCPEH